MRGCRNGTDGIMKIMTTLTCNSHVLLFALTHGYGMLCRGIQLLPFADASQENIVKQTRRFAFLLRLNGFNKI